jgi:hypothetical protein
MFGVVEERSKEHDANLKCNCIISLSSQDLEVQLKSSFELRSLFTKFGEISFNFTLQQQN